MSLVLLAMMVIVVLAVQLLVAVLRRQRAPAMARPGEGDPAPLSPPTAPPGTFIAPTHSWLRFAADGTLRIGIDDLLAGALGSVDAVELPDSGTHVERGEPLVGLSTAGQRLALLAPAAGEVVNRNPLAMAHPENVADDPYGLGWLLRLAPTDHKQALEPLYIGRGADGFLRREYRRLIEMVAALASPQAAHLADGGFLEKGAIRRLGAPAIDVFEQQFLR